MNLRFYIADKNNRPIIDYNAIIILFDTGASTPADLILPGTMFRGMELSWNQEYVDTPYIEIKSHTNFKYVFVQKCADKFFSQELLKYIYSQENAELEEIKTGDQSG